MRFSNELALDAVAMTQDRFSAAINAQYVLQASVVAVVSAGSSPVGTLKIEVSNDQPQSGTMLVPTNWIVLADVDVDITADGVYLIPKFDVCYQWMRIWFDYTSGSGTLSVRVKTNGA